VSRRRIAFIRVCGTNDEVSRGPLVHSCRDHESINAATLDSSSEPGFFWGRDTLRRAAHAGRRPLGDPFVWRDVAERMTLVENLAAN
jgi:hypothetical protein